MNKMESIRQAIKLIKVKNRAKIRNQYNQAPHLTQDTKDLFMNIWPNHNIEEKDEKDKASEKE